MSKNSVYAKKTMQCEQIDITSGIQVNIISQNQSGKFPICYGLNILSFKDALS